VGGSGRWRGRSYGHQFLGVALAARDQFSNFLSGGHGHALESACGLLVAVRVPPNLGRCSLPDNLFASFIFLSVKFIHIFLLGYWDNIVFKTVVF